MNDCPSCGHANPPDARFCSSCGVALAAEPPSAHEERKVVTVLFADLVGFTSTAEQLDPEDVRGLLTPYYTRLRAELEHFGGTVEKFIGDAVMALFGAPTAHEDDPERAVRAALAIRDWVRDEERIQVRIGVNTGEALIALGARPSAGEGMAAGDVVNTAARLQTAAPVNGVFVGERTYRATREAIEYGPATEVAVKGKDQPVSVWEALEPSARLGVDVLDSARAPLVGRERELAVLRDALDRVRVDRAPQLVTVVGVPGIGKSRLLYELSALVDADPDLIAWRQGRSLPYGEGVSFWALAEMAKAQAGILETDTADEADAKLIAAVSQLVDDDAEVQWVCRHLRSLIGIDTGTPSGGTNHDEAFGAWRRFIEGLADVRPTVLVFEDLHWADDGLLDFVDHLVDWVTDVPLLVVCTCRPELLTRRPGWGGGKANAVTLSLSQLNDTDTSRLFAALLSRAVLDAEQQQRLLANAGGNPLYAEQYAQLVLDHPADEALPLPDTVHGIIGARLDALSPAEKRLLQDAAVIGKVFWPAAVAALDDSADEASLHAVLHTLERKQFVRRERSSSVAGQNQYAFLHILVRDVAYGQIPRSARIDKHVRAGGWIETLGRRDELAETLAHHYLSAFELARAAVIDVEDLAPRARAALRDAGLRASGLNSAAAAARYFEAALELCPANLSAEHAELRYQVARAGSELGNANALEELDEARNALVSVDNLTLAAAADAHLAEQWWYRGNQDRCFEHLNRADELIRLEPDSPEKGLVLWALARFRMLAGQDDFEAAEQSLAIAEALGIDDLRASVLITLGTMRANKSDIAGIEMIQEGLDIALAGNYLATALRGYSNVATMAQALLGDQRASLQHLRDAERIVAKLGTNEQKRWFQGNILIDQLEIGEWDECLYEADEFIRESAVGASHYLDAMTFMDRGFIKLARGDVEGALADQADGLAAARRTKDPQVLHGALALSAYTLALAGRRESAESVFDELLAQGPAQVTRLGYILGDALRAADALGRLDEAATWLGPDQPSAWYTVGRAIIDGDHVGAADQLDRMGAVRSAALARLRAAQHLDEQGQHVAVAEQLAPALAFFRAVGASLFVSHAEALLAASA